MKVEQFFPWKNIEEYLNYRLQGIGSSLKELKEVGVIEDEYPSSIYVPLEYLKFKTPSGKVELYSDAPESYGFDPLPTFKMPEEPPEGFYRLIYGRSPAHTFGKTVNNPILNELMSENELWVNTHVASQWGLKNGQYINLKNTEEVKSNKIKSQNHTNDKRRCCLYGAWIWTSFRKAKPSPW